LLNPIEEPLDPAAGTKEIGAEADQIGAIAFGGMLAMRLFSWQAL
jgi:hypothetical protein